MTSSRRLKKVSVDGSCFSRGNNSSLAKKLIGIVKINDTKKAVIKRKLRILKQMVAQTHRSCQVMVRPFLCFCFRLVNIDSCAGKQVSEEETKEEFKLERDPPPTHEEGSLCPTVTETMMMSVMRAAPLLCCRQQLVRQDVGAVRQRPR